MCTVNILVPCFNAGLYLDKTIESVLHQTFGDWELVILDDCSTDNSFELAHAYSLKDSRIKVIRNEVNLGMLNNWNKGINLCQAPYFVKLDADDIWESQMLEKALQVLENDSDIGLVFSRYINIDEQGQFIPNSDIPLPDFARNRPFSCVPLVLEGPHKMLSYPILRQGLSVMRRNVFEEIGQYRSLLTAETQAATDTEFYFRVGARFKIFCIDEILYQYRVHQKSISATDAQSFLSEKKLYEIKWSIIEYYYQQKLLTAHQRDIFLNEVQKEYNFTRIAQLRKAGDILTSIQLLTHQILNYPKSSLLFYYKRVINKVNSNGNF